MAAVDAQRIVDHEGTLHATKSSSYRRGGAGSDDPRLGCGVVCHQQRDGVRVICSWVVEEIVRRRNIGDDDASIFQCVD